MARLVCVTWSRSMICCCRGMRVLRRWRGLCFHDCKKFRPLEIPVTTADGVSRCRKWTGIEFPELRSTTCNRPQRRLGPKGFDRGGGDGGFEGVEVYLLHSWVRVGDRVGGLRRIVERPASRHQGQYSSPGRLGGCRISDSTIFRDG